MNDAELKDNLAFQYSIQFEDNVAAEEDFKAGWDAARANPLRDEKRLWDKNELIKQERDQLREAAEKLAEACEEASEWYRKDDVNGEAGEIAFKALAEYRKQFPKANE